LSESIERSLIFPLSQHKNLCNVLINLRLPNGQGAEIKRKSAS